MVAARRSWRAICSTSRNVIPWWLLIPQGVSGANKGKAGLSPMPLGSAVVTGAGRLSLKAIIHVAGIKLLWRASEASIRNSTVNAMARLLEGGWTSIALPILGAGSGGFNQENAERLMVQALESVACSADVRLVRFRPS